MAVQAPNSRHRRRRVLELCHWKRSYCRRGGLRRLPDDPQRGVWRRRHSCGRGLRVFDYGRSKQGTGSYSFKKNWGFDPRPLFYEYYLVKARQMPDISPMNPKYRLFIDAWKRLPLPVTRVIGPLIARNLG